MITIIHGENQVSAKNQIAQLKKSAGEKDIIILDGKNLNLSDLESAFLGNSLFGNEKLVIIERLLAQRPSRQKDAFLQFITDPKHNFEIILSEDKEISPLQLKKFKNAKIYDFKPAANIFKFVDKLKPGNSEGLVNLFHELIKTEPPEVVFVMIVRQIRNMLLAKDKTGVFLENFPVWMRGKIISQSLYFTNDYLLTIHRKLLDIDYKVKTGQSPYTLKEFLDIFLINL